jgi:hypothetical protein
MSYGSPDIGSLRFLSANVIYQLTQKLLNSEDAEDRGALDDGVLLMDAISSYHTEKDKEFAAEMQAVEEARRKSSASVKPGHELDPSVLETYRWRELKAMFRSMCRQGIHVRQESPSTEWVPESGGR